MARNHVRNLCALLLIVSTSVHAADPAPGACEVAATNKGLQSFPIKDLTKDVVEKTVDEGTILPTPIGVANNKRVISTVPSVTAFFAANVLPTFATLDARNTEAYSNSLAISFLRQFGLVEMATLGPDLSKPDPFLDTPEPNVKSPSEEKVDLTNRSLAELANHMTKLLSKDQASALDNLLRGNVAKSVHQVQANIRTVLAKAPFLKDALSGFLTDKKFLQDIQRLFLGNLEQFEQDIKYIDQIQSRYQKVRDALEKLSNEGKAMANMKAAILGTIKDEATKRQVEKELVRFEARVTDLTAGMAIADTFINMWQIVKDNHFELIAGLTRSLNFTIPIIGASQQLTNALARQARTQAAINLADRRRDDLLKQMQDQMQTNVKTQHEQEMAAITNDAETLGTLLVGTIMIQQTIAANDQEKVIALRAAREKYDKISAEAKKQRETLATPLP